MVKRLGLALIGASLVAASAEAQNFNVVRRELSTIGFVSRQMGVPVDGRFSVFDARITFDPARPHEAAARIDVRLAGVDLGNDEINQELKGKGWFDVAAFPVARFQSTRIQAAGNGRYDIAGRMTLKGRVRDVRFSCTGEMDRHRLVLEGTLPLRRLDYGVGSGVWGDTDVVADEVHVHFRFIVDAST